MQRSLFGAGYRSHEMYLRHVLLKKGTLEAIATGDVDLAFRRWKRPTVKAGGELRTAAGLVEIRAVDVVSVDEITASESRRAGFELDDLLALLDSRDGELYRVEFGEIRPDPRVALRNEVSLSQSDLDDVISALARLDQRAKRGPWTRRYLQLIRDNPLVRAQDLADDLRLEKDDFKNEVRKLKALGLTISHSPGYELSPRGEFVLDRLP